MKEFILKILMALVVYLTPLFEPLTIIFVFVTVDFVTGIIASRKRGIPCSSRRLRISVTKLVCYMSAVMLSFMLQKTFNLDWFVVYKYVGALICVIEFISILENFAVITEHPFFMKLIKFIRGKASKTDNMIGEIINEKNSKDERW